MRWTPWLVAGAALSLWELLVRSGTVSAVFFPAPTKILAALGHWAASGHLAEDLAATLSRVGIGFICGGLPGLTIGLTTAACPRLRRALDPIVAAVHPIPKIAILPIIMIIFGIGETARVILVATAAFFPMWIIALAGVDQINPVLFDVARNCGATPMRVFTRVIVPGALPVALAGARIAINLALLITIAVELVAANDGLGEMMWFAWQTLRTEDIYAGLVVIALLGITINVTLQGLKSRLAPWHVDGAGR